MLESARALLESVVEFFDWSMTQDGSKYTFYSEDKIELFSIDEVKLDNKLQYVCTEFGKDLGRCKFEIMEFLLSCI